MLLFDEKLPDELQLRRRHKAALRCIGGGGRAAGVLFNEKKLEQENKKIKASVYFSRLLIIVEHVSPEGTHSAILWAKHTALRPSECNG